MESLDRAEAHNYLIFQYVNFLFVNFACPACPVECEAHSSGVAPEDGAGVPFSGYIKVLFVRNGL